MDNEEDVMSFQGEDKSLTDWTKEPKLADLKGDLEAAQGSHDAQLSKIRHWENLRTVSGSVKPKKVKGRSSVQPKLIRRQAEWRYSALTEPFLGSSKLFKITPTTFEDEFAANQNELVLNWQFRTKLNRIKLIDDLVRSTTDEGTGIMRLGWQRQTEMVTEVVPVFSFYPIEEEEHMEALQAALELKASDPRSYNENIDEDIKASVDFFEETEQATIAVQEGEEEVEVENIISNHPTVEVMNPNNVVIDPSCNGELDKAQYVVVSFETSKLELLKQTDRYKNLDKVDWENATPSTEPNHSTTTPTDFHLKDINRKPVVAYEYWGYYDIHDDDTLVPIVATWIGSTLIRMEENPFPDGKLPFVVVPYSPIKRELYGEPDAELLEDNQAILGAVTRGMIDLMGRSANAQQGFAKGMLDPVNRRRYENGQDYEYNPNSNPAMSLIEHKYPEIPNSAMLMVNLQNQDAEALSGVKSFSGGMSGNVYGDVAAGIRGMLDAASKREMAILRRLAKGMTEVGQKIMSMNAVFMSEEETIRVTNRMFVAVKREDLQGNFDLEVDISTAEVDDAKSQDLSFMLQTVGPNADPAITMMILGEIADLKRMPELAEKLRTWKPEPTEQEIELQELELEMARLDVAKKQAEIGLIQAETRALSSEADQADLDYVDQESGAKHSRDMEKQKAQAQGNQNLQITKALTTPRKDGEMSPNLDAAIGFNAISGSIGNEDTSNEVDPRLNIGSKFYEPDLDPSLNPNLNF